jgi:hypothetical protein
MTEQRKRGREERETEREVSPFLCSLSHSLSLFSRSEHGVVQLLQRHSFSLRSLIERVIRITSWRSHAKVTSVIAGASLSLSLLLSVILFLSSFFLSLFLSLTLSLSLSLSLSKTLFQTM